MILSQKLSKNSYVIKVIFNESICQRDKSYKDFRYFSIIEILIWSLHIELVSYTNLKAIIFKHRNMNNICDKESAVK